MKENTTSLKYQHQTADTIPIQIRTIHSLLQTTLVKTTQMSLNHNTQAMALQGIQERCGSGQTPLNE
jgi:hypothetical protein